MTAVFDLPPAHAAIVERRIVQHLPLAAKLAKEATRRLGQGSTAFDDCYSDALLKLGVIAAEPTYDHVWSGTNEVSFLATAMRWGIIDGHRERKVAPKVDSRRVAREDVHESGLPASVVQQAESNRLPARADWTDGEPVPNSRGMLDAWQTTRHAEGEIDLGDFADICRQLLGGFPAKQRAIFFDVVFEERTLQDAGARQGVSESRACQVVVSLRAYLRTAYDQYQTGELAPGAERRFGKRLHRRLEEVVRPRLETVTKFGVWQAPGGHGDRPELLIEDIAKVISARQSLLWLPRYESQSWGESTLVRPVHDEQTGPAVRAIRFHELLDLPLADQFDLRPGQAFPLVLTRARLVVSELDAGVDHGLDL